MTDDNPPDEDAVPLLKPVVRTLTPAARAYLQKLSVEAVRKKKEALKAAAEQSRVLNMPENISDMLIFDFIKKCIWWETHSSGKPVRAPNFAYRASSGPSGWALEFGANYFLVEKFLRSSKVLLGQYVEAGLNGFKLRESEVRKALRELIQSSVANYSLSVYEKYPVDSGKMMFGAHSISMSDAEEYLLMDTGLSGYFK